jgi:hypothetical protein
MTLSHAILAIAIAAIVGIGLGYGFRGLINRIGKYFRKDIEAVLSDTRNRLNTLYASTETDLAKYKDEIHRAIVAVEKKLP